MYGTPGGCHRPGCRPQEDACKGQSVLLNRICESWKKRFPCRCEKLEIECLPRRAKPPFTLEKVTQGDAEPTWTQDDDIRRGRLICVTIPLCCVIRDACGETYRADAEVTVEAQLPCPRQSMGRGPRSMVILPCVWLCGKRPCSQDRCFDAPLEITLEIYVVRPEPCLMRRPPAPKCPDMPLYPHMRENDCACDMYDC